MTNYLNDRYEHNEEQRIWFCWLYGNTYHLPTAWILMNEFPDFELATYDRMDKWNTENYKRLRYQTDTKWNKGHLADMFSSYKKFIGDRTQKEAIESYYSDNSSQSFDNLWKGVKGDLYKFGRYSTWFYLQHLKHTCEIQIDPTSMMLNDYSGSKSHRNGLLMGLNRDDEYDKKLTKDEYEYLEDSAKDIILETKNRYPEISSEADNFTFETCLCSYKKIFRKRHGRYLGYYLDRQAEEITKVSGDRWHGIDWEVLWQSREEILDKRLTSKSGIKKFWFDSYLDEGYIKRVDWLEDKNV